MKPSLLICLVLSCLLLPTQPAQAKDPVTLHREAASAAQMQTRAYGGLDEANFLPLCEAFLEKNGWKISVVVPELGLVRAWKPQNVYSDSEKTKAVLLSILTLSGDTTVDKEKWVFAVITVNPQAEGVAVRTQFTYKTFDENWMLTGHDVDPTPEDYKQFFDKLDTAVAARNS